MVRLPGVMMLLVLIGDGDGEDDEADADDEIIVGCSAAVRDDF